MHDEDRPRCAWCNETARTGICRRWPHDRRLWARPGLRAFLIREHYPHECNWLLEERAYLYPASYVARLAQYGEDMSGFGLPRARGKA